MERGGGAVCVRLKPLAEVTPQWSEGHKCLEGSGHSSVEGFRGWREMVGEERVNGREWWFSPRKG